MFVKPDVDHTVISEFIYDNQWKDTTRDLKLSLLCYFFDFLKWRPNPARKVPKPEYIRNIPDVLTSEKINRLLSVPYEGDPKGIRDKAILECLYYCLLSVGELTELRLRDISLEENRVRVKSIQKRKERIIPLEASARHALVKYLEEVREDRGQDHVFLSFTNRVGIKGISDRSVERDVLRGYADQLNLKKMTPSTLRNSRATHLLDSGAEVKSVLKLLGLKYPPVYMYPYLADK